VTNYTIKNLKEVEDAAPKFGMPPGIEARFARTDLEFEGSGLSYQRFEPGFRVPFGHRHERQEEVYVLVNGSGRMKLEDEIVELRQWDAVRVAGGTMRAFEAGPEGAELLAFGAPATGPSDADIVPGWWSD
jgi:mannose-6-phosphate isomerase-like protein (cupin superfamily)